jgi:hypothetical protein
MTDISPVYRVGAMRLVLLLLAVASCPMALFTDMEPQGFGIFAAYIMPSLVVILFFVLLLDALMNRVFMVEQDAEEVSRRRLRMYLCLVAVAGLLVCWLPYFRNIGAL